MTAPYNDGHSDGKSYDAIARESLSEASTSTAASGSRVTHSSATESSDLHGVKHISRPDDDSAHDSDQARKSRRLSQLSDGSSYPGYKRDGLGSLVRLVEALEPGEAAPYEPEAGIFDSYSDVSFDTALGKKKGSHNLLNSFSHVSLASKAKYSVLDAYSAAAGLDEEIEEEYCAAPFNYGNELDTPGLPPIKTSEHDGEEEAKEEVPWPAKPYRRRRRMNWSGCAVMLFYLAALGFYLWVRFTKTLTLGSYLWYGIFVLACEIAGATTTLLFGLNLIWHPVREKIPEDPDNPGLTKVDAPYHIRVLVPCYKEPLDIVYKTVKAAVDAVVPAGCTKTVYVCDDSKDALKRKRFRNMGPDVVYVSGRTRELDEVNGKSGNLNNCLNQLYPEDTPVPLSELVCVFDADQVANADFFLKTVPLFDSGDDVAMVLSPQCFHNINIGADIFNHSNIQFWEYAQHGYDALGFISCTGTNFLIRAKAFQDCGWSPTYTLTEDYALGMELMMRKWKCRYVEEYLAVGEAPEQVRNCFQQRSRWAKGHFQMVFSSEHCPIFQSRLSLLMRILFCSGVWAYVVGGITTPLFIAVPLITVWAGVFPLVVSWWAALALSVYISAQYLVLNYSRKGRHVMPLWFANIASAILWFTFVKAAWRSIAGLCGQTITFKTTLKGAKTIMNSAIGDLWIPGATFLVCLASLILGLYKVITGPTVITTLSISVVWLVYAIIPPYLLIHYTWVGRGATLRFACKIAFYLTTLCAVCAIVLLWLVYPPEYDYGKALNESYLFYEAERVGVLPPDNRISWRGDALTYEIGPTALGFGNLTGGWMMGGEAGTLKVTMPTAYATSMLAWGLLAFPQGYEKAGAMEAAKSSLRWSVDYLQKVIAPDAALSTSLSPEWNIIYQVGNISEDLKFWGRPEDMTMRRPTYWMSTRNGTSDLGGQLVASYVASALVFKKDDPALYQRLMNTSVNLYGAITRRRAGYTSRFLYPCARQTSDNLLTTLIPPTGCPRPENAFSGAMLVQFNSTSYRDDLAWAASWLYKATGDKAYLADAYTYWQEHINREGDDDVRAIVDWNNVIWPVTFMLAKLTDDTAFHYNAQGFLQRWLCSSAQTIEYTQNGRAYNLYSQSLGTTASAAFLSVLYGDMVRPEAGVVKFNDPSKSERYTCWARKQSRYILGDSGYAFMVGQGPKYPTHVQDRAASCPSSGNGNVTCNKVTALFTPQPNPHTLTGALVEFPTTTDNFLDDRTSNMTRVGVVNQAGFPGLLAGLVDAPGTWDGCLQGFGVLSKDTAVCGGV